MRSLDLRHSDEILVLDHAYQACWNAVDYVTKKSGAKTTVVTLPFPITSPEEIIESILNSVTKNTKLALIDTVTALRGLGFHLR